MEKKLFSLNFSVDHDVNDNVYIKIRLFKLAVKSRLFVLSILYMYNIEYYAFHEYFPKVLAEQ